MFRTALWLGLIPFLAAEPVAACRLSPGIADGVNFIGVTTPDQGVLLVAGLALVALGLVRRR